MLAFVAPARAGDAADADPVLEAITSQIPACAPERAHCFGIVLHVAPASADGDALVADGDWLARQIAVANEHFAAVDVAFELERIERLDASEAIVADRDARDALGRGRFGRGVVHVFVVARLDNVDEEGEIYGVHWRDREARSRRWIILSAIAWETTLAHELGHFFGLAHSDYAVSIMNKTARSEPPLEERTFHDDELVTMRKRRDRMVEADQLVERSTDARGSEP